MPKPSLSIWFAALLFLFIFPALWAFQIARNLHYEIVRDQIQLDCNHRETKSERKTHGFVGVPAIDFKSETKSQTEEISKPFARAWCHDLDESFNLKIGSQNYTGSCLSQTFTIKSGRQTAPDTSISQPAPKNPTAFIYFIFLPKIQSELNWADTELQPNLILIQWPNLQKYLLNSISIKDLIFALVFSISLVFSFNYFRNNFHRIFDFKKDFPSSISLHSLEKNKQYWIFFAISLSLFALYFLPIFHNIVLLYFSQFTLALFAFHKFFLKNNSEGNPPKVPLKNIHRILLMLLLTIGLGLRVYKADWGFPLLLHTDEYAITSFPAQMAAKNSLDPIDYERPNHSSIYLSSILYGIASHAIFHAPLEKSYPEHEQFYHLISRVAEAILGVACIYIAFLIGMIWSPRLGILSALLFTFFPQFVLHSHYATPDISLTFAILGVLLFSLKYLHRPILANLFYATFFAAIASVEKYPGVLSLAALVSVIFFVHWKQFEIIKAHFARIAIFFFTLLFFLSPYLVLKPHMVLLNLISESRPTHLGQDGLGFFGNLLYYVHAYGASTSFILTLFFCLGIFAFLKNYTREFLPLSIGFFYWIIISNLPIHWERWDLPMVISPLLLTAFGIDWLWNLIDQKKIQTQSIQFVLQMTLIIISGIAVVNLLLKDFVVLAKLKTQDTRMDGLNRCQAFGINEKNSLVGHYTPLSPTWKRGFDFISSFENKDSMEGKEYAMVSSDLYNRYFNEPDKYKKECDFYNSLFSLPLKFEIVPNPLQEKFENFNDLQNLKSAKKTFESYAVNHSNYSTGPIIKVFQLNEMKN